MHVCARARTLVVPKNRGPKNPMVILPVICVYIFVDDYIICLNMNYLSTIFKATDQKGLRKNELEWYITEKKDAKEGNW